MDKKEMIMEIGANAVGLFILQCREMAEKNWLPSQINMLERLFGAVMQGVEYADWEPSGEPFTEEELKDKTMQGEKMSWIPIEEKSPENDQYVLVSFENFSMPDIARYSEEDGGGAYYPGDDEKTYLQYGLFVNAWMSLPKPYREEK